MSKITKKGVKIPTYKSPAFETPLGVVEPQEPLLLPLVLSDGVPCRAVVCVADRVRRGDVLGRSQRDGRVLSAPADGVVEDVQELAHPLLGMVEAVALRVSPAAVLTLKKDSPRKMQTADDILEAIRQADIVDEADGLPLAEKLEAWKACKEPLFLVADASEQQPYGSSAWAALDQDASAVRDGLALMAMAVQAVDCRIAYPRKWKKRWPTLPAKLWFGVRRRYPWYEEGLTQAVPKAGRATVCRVGVQACRAVWDTVQYGQAPTGAIVTVAGSGIRRPQNLWVPFGTMVSEVLAVCGVSNKASALILGDALTGVAAACAEVPIVAGVTCLLVLEPVRTAPAAACIGCGRCVRTCHAGLLPYEIMWRLDSMQYDELDRLLPDRCDGCGVCSYVCPSKLPVAAKVLEAREAHGTIFLNWGDGDDL